MIKNVLTQWGYTGYLLEKGEGVRDIGYITENTFGDYLFVHPEFNNEFTVKVPKLNARLRVA